MAYCIEDLVRRTFSNIQGAIALSNLVIAVTIKAYIDKVDDAEIIATIVASYLPRLPSLLTGLTNSFTGLDQVHW